MNRNERAANQDKIRGSLVGGAIGDALGYSIEFFSEDEIFSRYGEKGISEYELEKLYPKKVEGTIPTIEEIEKGLQHKIDNDN